MKGKQEKEKEKKSRKRSTVEGWSEDSISILFIAKARRKKPKGNLARFLFVPKMCYFYISFMLVIIVFLGFLFYFILFC